MLKQVMIIKNNNFAVEKRDTAIVAITEKGKKLAKIFQKLFPDSEIFTPDKNITEVFNHIFKKYKNIIAIMATGIVVRKIAGLLKSKTVDPAVVVTDENGKFAISLISGHLGGANELARYIASKTGAVPVITTATDVNGKFAIDLLPYETGWEIANPEMIKVINSGILKNLPVATNISSEFFKNCLSGCNSNCFENFIFFKNENEVLKSNVKLKVIVSSRTDLSGDFLLFLPKNLYLGIGCNRGTELSEIEEVVFDTLRSLNRSFKAVNSISSFELKADEPALIEFGRKYNIKMNFYTKDELNSVAEFYQPSDYLIKNIGVKGVCEPSAILSAKKDMKGCFKRRTLLAKKKTGNVTIAVQELYFA